ncbi:MAG TPA: GAF domain-containing protein [Ramlibacter sp.]|jgi:GAF domain-containing protein
MNDRLDAFTAILLPRSVARLLEGAAQIGVATADSTNDPVYLPIQEFLAQVRTVFRMDVAFVSEFAQDQRIFRVVSAAVDDPGIRVGEGDPTLDTYCRMVVEDRLDRCVPDTAASPAAGMAVTRRLRIGAYLAATIRLTGGQVFGTLCCYSHTARLDLQDKDADILQVLADAVAASVDKHGDLRQRVWLGAPAADS